MEKCSPGVSLLLLYYYFVVSFSFSEYEIYLLEREVQGGLEFVKPQIEVIYFEEIQIIWKIQVLEWIVLLKKEI